MTNQEALEAATTARHRLLIGASAVEVDVLGTGGANYRVRFTAANREALDSYIAELEAKIVGVGVSSRGAIGFVL